MSLTYAEARSLIETGDLIAVHHPHGLIGVATQFFTRSKYTHTGLAIWMDEVLWMFELNSGRNHIIPMSQLSQVGFDVYAAPPGLVGLHEAILEWLREPIDYSPLAFLVIGFLSFFGINKFIHWRRELVCAGVCVGVYESRGWGDHSRLVSPGALCAALDIKFEVLPER